MTFPRFLDCAWTLLYDEWQRIGVDIETAYEKMSQWSAGGKTADAEVGERAKPQVATAGSNALAMQQLQGLLGGVKGGPAFDV